MTWWRLLLRTYGSRIVAALVGATALLLVGDFAELASALGKRSDTVSLALELYRHKLPTLALQALPLALLFGVLLALADLSRSRELLALRVAGAAPLRLAVPAVALAAAFAAGALWVGDTVAPRGMREVVRIETRKLHRWSWYWTVFHKRQSWYLGQGGGLYHVGRIEDDGRRLKDVTRYDQRGGRLTRMAKADEAVREDGTWAGRDVEVWRFDPDHPERVELGHGPLPIDEPPSHFAGVLGQPEELSLAQLREAITVRRAQGRPALPMEVELRARVATPLLGLALVVLALGLAFAVRTPENAVEASVLGMIVAFLGWMLLAVMRALGLAGVVAPWAAAWVPVIVPALLGGVLLVSTTRFRILASRAS